MCTFPHKLGSPSSYITLQLLHSEFVNLIFFLSVQLHKRLISNYAFCKHQEQTFINNLGRPVSLVLLIFCWNNCILRFDKYFWSNILYRLRTDRKQQWFCKNHLPLFPNCKGLMHMWFTGILAFTIVHNKIVHFYSTWISLAYCTKEHKDIVPPIYI